MTSSKGSSRPIKLGAVPRDGPENDLLGSDDVVLPIRRSKIRLAEVGAGKVMSGMTLIQAVSLLEKKQ